MMKSFVRLFAVLILSLLAAGCATVSIPEDRLRIALKDMEKPSFLLIDERGLTREGCGFLFLVRDVTWCQATWISLPLEERMHFLLQDGSPVTLGLLEAGRIQVLAEALQEARGSKNELSLDEAKRETLALGNTMFQACTRDAKGRAEEDACIFALAQLASEVNMQRALATVARIEAEDDRARRNLARSMIFKTPTPYRLPPPTFFRDASGKIRIKR